jgi:hypothetical protein
LIGDLGTAIKSMITGKVSPQEEAAIADKINSTLAAVNAAQSEVNKIEASNPSVFVSGWRPALGWVCATSLGAYYIPQALIGAILWLIQCIAVMRAASTMIGISLPAYPVVFNVEEIIGLVASMLGMAGLRSFDKTQGTARN